MKIYRTKLGVVVEDHSVFYLTDANWDELINRPLLEAVLTSLTRRLRAIPNFRLEDEVLAPISQQEVWAAGVTYVRSRAARMDEAKEAGGGDFYDRVYSAARPELFFKATPHRVSGTGEKIGLRRDSRWTVPEPELALAVNSAGNIFGFTIGNDVSSRDIEGENPLYLPQAKVYNRSCGLGPGILITTGGLPRTTPIELEIERGDQVVFHGETELSSLKRSFEELVEFLMRDNSFPYGCFLLTGTGIVPPDEFSLEPGDVIRITIEPIGTLMNIAASAAKANES